jgi:hypothetical protein
VGALFGVLACFGPFIRQRREISALRRSARVPAPTAPEALPPELGT